MTAYDPDLAGLLDTRDDRPRIVNLLDDFGEGGVTRGLGIFAARELTRMGRFETVAIAHDAVLAPNLDTAAGDADVILVHFPPNWRRLALIAGLRACHPRARIVLVEHSYTGAWEALKVASPRRFRAMLRLALPLYHHVVCVSSGQADWLAAVAHYPRARIAVIHPHGLVDGLDAVPAPAFADDRALTIGAYGRFSEQKGFERLVAAARAGHLGPHRLLLGGFGPDEARLRALAGDDPRIAFFGKVVDLPDFLSRCDVVALPSRWEAYGQVANEAREAGRPILVAPVDGLPEQVGDAGRVVDFTDGPALARTLAGLDAATLTAMSRAAREATRDCGKIRAREWRRLLQGLLAR